MQCFWTVRGESGERRVLPDGCADLVFDLSRGQGMAVGPMTRPLLVSGPGDFLGVRFRPGRAAAFLRMPLAELTDARVPLGDLWRTAPVIENVAALEAMLLRRLEPDRDPRVDAAVERIVATGGAERVDAIAHDIGISRQHLARTFLHHVGVPPKTFARVMRFRRILETGSTNADWADVAAAHGYYDQSHLIADFRQFAGTTPSAFHFSNP